MLRAVIFDFDGVITDSEILHLRTFNEVLAQYDIEITTRDYYTQYLGSTDFDCFKVLSDKHGLRLDERGIESLVRQKNEAFEQLAKTEGRIIEGVRGFFELLRDNNVRMAICSGSLRTEIELLLDEAGLRHFFEAVVSAEEVKKFKPDPEGFLLALRKLNETGHSPIQPAECVAIEDSHWGLEAAKRAGMHTVAVTNSYDARQLASAEKIVGNLGELGITDLQQLCE
ncbi:MAG: HAD family phosphatase [Planctomycetota bacterium]|nr:MAG: HAD family phosphatase [Planctomycetota bacterium]